MLIEYKITFQKDGLTISQQIGASPSPPQAKAVVIAKDDALKSSFSKSQAANATKAAAGGGPGDNISGPGGGPGDNISGRGGGPNGLDAAPVIFIGPIILGGPPPNV